MILNTGGRTDTVQYYSEWLLSRFREGYILSRNPLFPDIVNRIELNPKTIDVVVFCSKDYSPILERLHEITDRCIFSFVEMYKKLEVNMPELKPVSAEVHAVASPIPAISARSCCGIAGLKRDEKRAAKRQPFILMS